MKKFIIALLFLAACGKPAPQAVNLSTAPSAQAQVSPSPSPSPIPSPSPTPQPNYGGACVVSIVDPNDSFITQAIFYNKADGTSGCGIGNPKYSSQQTSGSKIQDDDYNSNDWFKFKMVNNGLQITIVSASGSIVSTTFYPNMTCLLQ